MTTILKRTIPLEIFLETIHVWVTDSDNLDIFKTDSEWPVPPEQTKQMELGDATCLSHPGNCESFLLFSVGRTNLTTILHETIHAYTALLKHHDLDTSLDVNEESHAYILSYIQHKVFEAYYELKMELTSCKKKKKK